MAMPSSKMGLSVALTGGITMALAVSLLPLAGSGGGTGGKPADDAQRRLSAPVLAARPDDGTVFTGRNIQWSTQEAGNSPVCHAVRPICVHWTNFGSHAPPAADNDSDNIPDQVERTLTAAVTSWNVIVGDLGFRAPLPDRRSRIDGGNDKFDIYLADTGAEGLSGYTSSDDRRLSENSTYKYRDVSAFMVLDNDFRSGQFPNGSRLDNLRVSVAHELSHASQFAYDYKEDRWFAEGTATWIEDEVFDDINLNRSALKESPLKQNFTSMDFGRDGFEYGSWIFLRYLSEKFGAGIIRHAWRLADDGASQVSTNRMQTYSMRAIGKALKQRHRDLHRVFSTFARDNLRPVRTYQEGSHYPKPTSFKIKLDRRDDTKWLGIANDHLSTTYVTFVHGDHVRRRGTLRIMIDASDRRFGPMAAISVRFTKGKTRDYTVKLDRKGDGAKRVPFGRRRVDGVDVSLVNTSVRMAHCFKRSTSYSCSGSPKDDDRPVQIRAHL